MKSYDLPNGQILEVYTLKETVELIKDYKQSIEWELVADGIHIEYKDGTSYDDNFHEGRKLKLTGIKSAELYNPCTIAVYGDFKLQDIDTGELFTVEEAMKRATDEDTVYNVVLSSSLKK